MNSEWFILRLCDHIQVTTHLDYIVSDLKKIFGQKVDFYIPIHTEFAHGKNIHLAIFEGYVFVKVETAEVKKNLKSIIYRSSVIDCILEKAPRVPYTLTQEEIDQFKNTGKSTTDGCYPEIGAKVQTIDGVLKGMDAVVIGVDKEKKAVQIRVTRRCREVDAWEKLFNIKIID